MKWNSFHAFFVHCLMINRITQWSHYAPMIMARTRTHTHTHKAHRPNYTGKYMYCIKPLVIYLNTKSFVIFNRFTDCVCIWYDGTQYFTAWKLFGLASIGTAYPLPPSPSINGQLRTPELSLLSHGQPQNLVIVFVIVISDRIDLIFHIDTKYARPTQNSIQLSSQN